MNKFAHRTEVPVYRTQFEIREMLEKRGITAFGIAEQNGQIVVIFARNGLSYRIILSQPAKDNGGEQMRIWRSLRLVIKAKLVAIDDGISTFEDEFLSHIVLANGQTIGELSIPALRAGAKAGTLPGTLALPGATR